MSLLKILLAIFLPPLAVLDRGLVPVLITLLATCLGWLPGVVVAFLYCTKKI